jgi:hypothetical protein
VAQNSLDVYQENGHTYDNLLNIVKRLNASFPGRLRQCIEIGGGGVEHLK